MAAPCISVAGRARNARQTAREGIYAVISPLNILMLVADVSFMIALTDAIVEPLATAVWYFVLDKFWVTKVVTKKNI